jgi:hypothetical protein
MVVQVLHKRKIKMRANYSLFQSHLDLAHAYWKELILSEDVVIDATCGQGFDSEVLAQLLPKRIYLFDIQREAIVATQQRLRTQPIELQFHQVCHSAIAEYVAKNSVKLIVYNLGYLPGGNKQVTTQADTTVQSVRCALDLLQEGGAISITCYPGHEQGAIEENALLQFCERLSPQDWNICWHRFLNRRAAPSLLLLQKAR